MEINSEQSKFEGWAVVNVLGHQRYAGHVTTEHFGQTVFFRVVTPAREGRTRIAENGDYIGNHHGWSYAAQGWRLTEADAPEIVRYVGAGSIYTLEPMSQDAVMKELDSIAPRKVIDVTDADGKPIEEREEMPW
jgi:hypothetical protein